ncbi:OstA-like protein [Pedobacter cryotolerans]|uniref:OstA-like protein n=1 Tax=Pedobacter cryotolerans TaxID=2571270 RepID=UPI001CEDB461|nr:OstA-like protein [Pedobacter cryotolerans]
MQKLRFFFLLLLFPSILFAQEQRTKIILERSTKLTVDTKTNINYVKNPVFRQDNATLTCDSAVFYKERNYFEAYKNVHINQGDTVNIYSDFLNYDGNKKLAHLNSNVVMKDLTSTLTTNVLDYDMGLKIGTYVNGGKIVNKDVTLTSKRGYYFANSKDAYFRYNVVAVTPQTTIKSDTLRYNTFTNWTYFYGPTNIKGKDDNLYTEDGSYNTRTENAYFGKKNLYTQGTKSLKGDSLVYNGKTGYGKAIKNIVFKDTTDKTVLYGQLGEYYKTDERVVVTKKAYFGMGTKDTITVGGKKKLDSLWLSADTLEAQMALQKTLKLFKKPVVQKDSEIGAEDEKEKEAKEKEKAQARKEAAAATLLEKKQVVAPEPKKKLSKKEQKAGDALAAELKKNPPPKILTDSVKILAADIKVKTDSIKLDSLKKAIDLPKKINISTAKKDSLKIDPKTKTAASKDPKVIVSNKAKAALNVKAKDSVAFNPADTIRTRVIKAFHNVRVFKSNLQAVSDSLFYTAADSTLRWYSNPILWSQGSQQTGDTIHVFFKNDKIHSFQVLQNSFAANMETDTTKFNQAKGRITTGFFKDGELQNMFIDGNAESIYFDKDEKNVFKNMNQTVSSRIKFSFKDKELTKVTMFREIEGRTDPVEKLPKNTLLTGFIWKPELRPTSKADIIKGVPAKPKVAPKSKTTTPKVLNPKSVGNDPSGIKPLMPGKKVNTEIKKPDSVKVQPNNPVLIKTDTTKKATTGGVN